VLPMTHKERFKSLGIQPPKGTVHCFLVCHQHFYVKRCRMLNSSEVVCNFEVLTPTVINV